mmetsp:Transcript_41153/g.54035  ORF Transcript_41153/g.54035 Transcript_41153/m.54035 type:complete len:87 (+) Transcript_41153:945-1205(+)
MMEIMVNECQKSSLKDLFKNFLSDTIVKQITKECSKVFPLENVLIKKVKVLKKPKFDLTKLMELYQSNAEKQTKTADPAATNALSK